MPDPATPDQPPEHEIDQVIVDYVQHTANRFGVQGLEDMITLAKAQLEVSRAALKELGDLGG
jgi:hypothetical protein